MLFYRRVGLPASLFGWRNAAGVRNKCNELVVNSSPALVHQAIPILTHDIENILVLHIVVFPLHEQFESGFITVYLDESGNIFWMFRS